MFAGFDQYTVYVYNMSQGLRGPNNQCGSKLAEEYEERERLGFQTVSKDGKESYTVHAPHSRAWTPCLSSKGRDLGSEVVAASEPRSSSGPQAAVKLIDANCEDCSNCLQNSGAPEDSKFED